MICIYSVNIHTRYTAGQESLPLSLMVVSGAGEQNRSPTFNAATQLVGEAAHFVNNFIVKLMFLSRASNSSPTS